MRGRHITAYLTADEAEQFEAQVEKEQSTENQLIKRALREYMERNR